MLLYKIRDKRMDPYLHQKPITCSFIKFYCNQITNFYYNNTITSTAKPIINTTLQLFFVHFLYIMGVN